jgi:TatA/E family protein of Tat protein translocase
MFSHLPEFIIIMGIGLIVFGPEKLPEIAANVGKMVREMRDMMDTAMNPRDTQVPDDFSTYYYESLSRSGEDYSEHEVDEPTLQTEGAMVSDEPDVPVMPGAEPAPAPGTAEEG